MVVLYFYFCLSNNSVKLQVFRNQVAVVQEVFSLCTSNFWMLVLNKIYSSNNVLQKISNNQEK